MGAVPPAAVHAGEQCQAQAPLVEAAADRPARPGAPHEHPAPKLLGARWPGVERARARGRVLARESARRLRWAEGGPLSGRRGLLQVAVPLGRVVVLCLLVAASVPGAVSAAPPRPRQLGDTLAQPVSCIMAFPRFVCVGHEPRERHVPDLTPLPQELLGEAPAEHPGARGGGGRGQAAGGKRLDEAQQAVGPGRDPQPRPQEQAALGKHHGAQRVQPQLRLGEGARRPPRRGGGGGPA
mmetsp:Transcript_11643/g.36996  ORF Transcript_11643/g.36996 Transcript_11643/m.36996 type:complete len:239 (+) Transcript_11643:630-1346(+)